MASGQDDDMYLFQGDMGQTPGPYAGQTFDSFLDATSTAEDEDLMNNAFLNPEDLIYKKENGTSPRVNPASTRASTSSSSSSSSSGSQHHHSRNISTATASPSTTKNDIWNTGINGMSMPMNEQYFDDANMAGIDQDLDQQMASAFDFDTAASTPSGFDSATMNSGKAFVGHQQMRRAANTVNVHNTRTTAPAMTAAPTAFFLGSREASPMSTMLTTSQAPSPWTKQSPASGLEETFHHMGMNGDSPGNATFSPNTMHVNYSDTPFAFHHESSGTPSSFAKDISSPPSTVHSLDGQTVLHIQPTSLKSRVETQIPIKMTLYPLPTGIKKLRLPTYAVSKPKFLAKSEVEKSPDTLELSVSLVCTSAMQDPHRKQRALARARGEDLSAYTRPSPTSSHSSSSRDDDEKPLNGGEVRICTGCIQRERKRASRKKQKKPEEEEMFQKDEERRVVVFNTNELKEWVEVNKENQPSDRSPPPPLGTMQVELPMRIACYCRHQNEKMGFQVIFTMKDYRDRVIAQAMTNSIMITDDHKTHNMPHPLPVSQVPQMPQPPHLPGAGVFATGGAEMPPVEQPSAKIFKQSYSTPDLTRLQHSFNGQFTIPNNTPFAIPTTFSANTSATLTPRNLSRPASPSGPSGPATKRRKPSGSGKLPSGLTMTRLDTVPTQSTGSVTMPNTAASSPFAPNMPMFMGGPDRNYQSAARPQTYGHSPPTPGGDGTFTNSINRSFSMENLPRQALISAPNSRQASRPGSPLMSHSRNSFGQNDSTFPQAVNNQLLGQSSRRPTPVIHKLVPAEGSTSGGTEVTLLGNGFYQGLEVMFGDTEATTTTFWGEKCLNCIAPPAVQPGMVAVVFKHEHPHYSAIQSPSHVRHSVFTYVDDREIELLRLALRTIGKQMGTDDPYTAAQQLLQQNQGHANGMFPSPYGMANGHQRGASAPGSQMFEPSEMEACLLRMLRFAKQKTGTSALRFDLRRPSGLTLLHLAASLDMSLFVAALLSAGADPNTLDNNGFSPMHHAAMNGHEEVIDKLRSAGGDHRLRSLRSFVPADLATTLQAYQATMRPYHHSRSRSSGANTLGRLSRNNSSKSLSSFWEDSSVPYTESESEVAEESSTADDRRLPYAQPEPFHAVRSRQASRRGSRQQELPSQGLVQTRQQIPEQAASSLMNAWRQIVNMTQAQQAQLGEQLQHLQESFPLPDYQNNNMMRRMSALFPQRPNTTADAASKEGWWDTFKRSSSPTAAAPPSYEELFPAGSDAQSTEAKKTSAIQAATDAAFDEHYSQRESNIQVDTKEARSVNHVPDVQTIQRVSLMQDRKLFLFWVSRHYFVVYTLLLTSFFQVPLLVILLTLMIGVSPISTMFTILTRQFAPQQVVKVV